MSWLSKFVFDPVKAAVARGASSSNPVTASAAQAAQTAINQIAQDANVNQGTSNSVIAAKNAVVGDLENGLQNVVSSFVQQAVTSGIPVVGGLVAPEAVKLANIGMDFAEQHALTYLSALFDFHRTNINSVPVQAQPQVQQQQQQDG